MSVAFTVAAVIAGCAIPLVGFVIGALARPAARAHARRRRRVGPGVSVPPRLSE